MFFCRVCLEHSDELTSLKSDEIGALPILHMLKEFTIVVSVQLQFSFKKFIKSSHKNVYFTINSFLLGLRKLFFFNYFNTKTNSDS